MSVHVLPRFPMDRWPAMRAFLAARYRPDVALCDRAMYAWFFRAGDDGAGMTTAWDGDRLVGTLGYLAGPVFWGAMDAPLDGAWLVNWAVDPAYRHGVGIALLRDVQTRFDVLLGIGAGAENERIVSRLGWAIEPRIARYVAVLDPRACTSLALPGITQVELEAAAVAGTFDDVARRWTPADGVTNWQRYPSMAFATLRDAAYLCWRYAEHPHFAYQLIATGQAGVPAVAVYRIEPIAPERTSALRVMEFFHPDDTAGRAAGIELAHALLARAASAGCAFVDHVGSATTYGDTLIAAGWSAEDPDHPLLPARLQPVERTPFLYNLEYSVGKGSPRPALTATYVTRGDGDADRPATARPDDDAAGQ